MARSKALAGRVGARRGSRRVAILAAAGSLVRRGWSSERAWNEPGRGCHLRRALSDRALPARRRHGRRLRGDAPGDAAQARAQGDAAQPLARRRDAAALPRGGHRRVGGHLRSHRGGVRRRHRRPQRRALHRHGAAARARARRCARGARALHAARGPGVRATGRRRARQDPRRRHRAPRSEAREPVPHAGRRRHAALEGARLRHRQAGGERHADRAEGGHAQHRHAHLHGARADRGPRRGACDGRVRAHAGGVHAAGRGGLFRRRAARGRQPVRAADEGGSGSGRACLRARGAQGGDAARWLRRLVLTWHGGGPARPLWLGRRGSQRRSRVRWASGPLLSRPPSPRGWPCRASRRWRRPRLPR